LTTAEGTWEVRGIKRVIGGVVFRMRLDRDRRALRTDKTGRRALKKWVNGTVKRSGGGKGRKTINPPVPISRNHGSNPNQKKKKLSEGLIRDWRKERKREEGDPIKTLDRGQGKRRKAIVGEMNNWKDKKNENKWSIHVEEEG